MNLKDEVLAGLVRCRLAQDDRISHLPIDVNVKDGDIHVLGTVDCEQQRKMVEMLIGGVCGVHAIITDFLVTRSH